MIYLDNHATTRVDPRVVEAMLPFYTEEFGNAGSSSHAFGEAARQAVEDSRATIAAAIGAEAPEIVFTSGATESNNLAIRGVAEQNSGRRKPRGNHWVSQTTEHQAVLEPLARLARRGHEVTLLDVEPFESNRAGWLDPQKVADALDDNTAMVSVMLANNEIGAIQPLAKIGEICRARGVLLHCDATQAIGRLAVDVQQLGVDLMSFSAHKIYGPKGVGALYVRQRGRRARLSPQLVGGGQEAGRRSGTLNTPGIAGFAKALDLCLDELPSESVRLQHLRNRLWEGLSRQLSNLQLSGPALDGSIRLPNNLNVSFGDVDGEALLLTIPEVAASSGATCASSEPGPSHVLLALGMHADQARSSVRFGIGRFNTQQEIDQAVSLVAEGVKQLRKSAPS